MVSGVVGILLERTVIRRLYGNPLETLAGHLGRQPDSSAVRSQCSAGPRRRTDACADAGLWPPTAASRVSVLARDLEPAWCVRGAGLVSALGGVLLAGGLASQISRIARATSRNVDVTAPKWMRGGIEWMDITFPGAAPGDHRDDRRGGAWGDVVPE